MIEYVWLKFLHILIAIIALGTSAGLGIVMEFYGDHPVHGLFVLRAVKRLDWDKYLGDAALTTAILDRLMHRSVLVEFRGKSYRLKEAASRLVKGNDSE